MANVEKVLVADDNEEDRAFFTSILRQDGFELEVASSGSQACALLEKKRFDLVITDLVMPGASGFEVMQAARQSNPEVICIALTSFGSLDSAMDALNLGAYSYLLKPCDAGAFRHCVQRGLEKQRLTKELRTSNQELQALNRELDAKVQDATKELRDLNRRVLTEMASLREVDELKNAFLNNVSHDLKGPITAILGYASCVLDDEEIQISEEVRFFVNGVRKSGTHLEYLINQLLEAAALDSHKVPLKRQAVPAMELVQEAAALFFPQAKAGGLRIETADGSGPRLTVDGDRGRLLRVLSNLIGNACKFTPSGGRIVVSARAEGESVRFGVEDTGPGIAPEHQPRIFEKFYQVDTSMSKPFKGLGLGLRIAKDLVELHGGRLWLESEPGKGSRFYFEIPKKTA
jgi:signal transduction histidine kinase